MSQLDIRRYLDIMDKMKGQKLAVETSDYMVSLMLELANKLQAEQQAHNELRKNLYLIEFVYNDKNGEYSYCPVCLNHEILGHKEGCWLHQAIKEERV